MPDSNDRDLFYVGYLPLPAAIKKFLVPWLVGNIVLAVGIAAVIASNHREPGDGVWDTSEAVTVEGWLTIDPYPLLRTDEQTYILVEQGKLGVQQRIEDLKLEPGPASVTGFQIEREGRTVLELDGTFDQPIEKLESISRKVTIGDPANPPRLFLSASKDLGAHTLRGEIVDPKCYLGVMQPGDGKTHKVCATLCIKGGIPPMLLVRGKGGATAAYLLTDAEGNAFPESHYGYIADPIELSGQVFRDGDLLVLRADLGSIRRLGASD